MVACPALPGSATDVAVIVTEPALSAVTTPAASTVATDSSLDDQVTDWTASAGLTDALNATVWPFTKKDASGETVTDAGTLRTVIIAVAVLPNWSVTVTVTAPLRVAATPVTVVLDPVAGSTLTSEASPLDHVRFNPAGVCPVNVAVNNCDPPTSTRADAGSTDIETTVILAVPVLEGSAVEAAVIVAAPGLTAVTTPVPSTVATDSSLEDQVTDWTASAGLIAAANATVWPFTKNALSGETATDAGTLRTETIDVAELPN